MTEMKLQGVCCNETDLKPPKRGTLLHILELYQRYKCQDEALPARFLLKYVGFHGGEIKPNETGDSGQTVQDHFAFP